MKVLVTGATGFVGQEICKHLLKNKSAQLHIVGRSTEAAFRDRFSHPCEYISWQELESQKQKLEDLDIVIHLAGDNIGDGRWTLSKKQLILNSRVQTTQKLVNVLITLKTPPRVVLSTSATGIYGNTHHQITTETSPHGSDFLAQVCKQWEESTKPLEGLCRLVIMRFGVILGHKQGLLKQLAPLFSIGLGGAISDGKMWMSPIAIHEILSIITFFIDTESTKGAYNLVSPTPITNKNFSKQLAKCYSKRLGPSVPAFILKLLLGEKSILALNSQRILPEKLLNENYHFKYKNIEDSLKLIYS